MNNKNKGFSLIEIIVVIAILAIVTGAAVGVISGTHSYRIKKITQSTDEMIGKTRTYTMTKAGSYELVIKKSGSDYVAIIYNNDNGTVKEVEKKNLGKFGSVYIKDPSNVIRNIDGNYELHISFKKGDGSFNKIYTQTASGGSKKDMGNVISFTYKGYSKDIMLSRLTGKHSIK